MSASDPVHPQVSTPAAHSTPVVPRSQQRTIVDTRVPKRWDGFLAYVVSQVGSPPVLIALVIILAATMTNGYQIWLWAGVYIVLAILSPLFYLFWLVRRGQVTDVDVQLREQRSKPLVVTLVFGGIAWLVLLVGSAPAQMALFAITLWLQTIIIFFITLRWKISMHAAAATAVAVAIWGLMGTPLPLLIGVPLVAWSRVRLRRHTAAQVVAGTLLSLIVFLPTLPLFAGG